MVDNRAAGFYGIGGAFNFKSGDISGTAASLQDDKQGQGNEYYQQRKDKDEQKKSQMNNSPYVDRSAQLNATLSSLAMLNVANVLNSKMRARDLNRIYDIEDENIEPYKEAELVYKVSNIKRDKREN